MMLRQYCLAICNVAIWQCFGNIQCYVGNKDCSKIFKKLHEEVEFVNQKVKRLSSILLFYQS